MYEYEVIRVHPDKYYSAWKTVRKLLEPAIKESGGRWQNEYVFAALVTRRQDLWVIVENNAETVAAFTTEIAAYPEKKMVAIHFLGGQGFNEWYPNMLKAVSEFGKQAGCDGIECLARSGFWKWFKQDGWERRSVFYEIAI